MLRKQRKGVALLYVTVAMTAMVAFCSLAVDLGRAQMVKTQLRITADAAARTAAMGITTGTSIADAIDIAGRNNADGKPIVLKPSDITLGYWDKSTHRFTAGGSPTNAAQCSPVLLTSRGTGLQMMFAPVLGFKSLDIHASAIAMVVPPINVNQLIQATANPFLAGMPPGTVASLNNPHNSPDYAGTITTPRQSPLVVNLPLADGATITFDSISGTARHDPHLLDYEPDGQLTDIGHNTNGSEHGIGDVTAPINALVGIFLGPNQPDLTPAPPSLDFSSDSSRNFSKLQPQLKQIFFIGDGQTDAGVAQQFVVPPGATRLYLATWDFYEWNNNSGNRTVRVNRTGSVTLVQ